MMRQGERGRDRPEAALYKVHIVADVDAPARKFRMWLYAADDGRMHAEIISGIGTTEVIIDSDSTRMAVHLLRRDVAYSGAVEPDTLRNLWGVDSSLTQFIGLMNGGSVPEGWSRVDGVDGYPRELRYEQRGRSIDLTLKKVQRLGVASETLGVGLPPEGVELRALSELRLEHLPGIEEEGGG